MPKSPGGAMPLITIDPGSRRPVFFQVYAEIRKGILENRLKPGTRLPSTRTMSIELGVSRNTILTAFEQLIAEGYLRGRVGSGTRVTEAIPEEMLHVTNSAKMIKRSNTKPAKVSRRLNRLKRIPLRISPVGSGPLRPFRVGTPALSEFPSDLWRRLHSATLSKLRFTALDYGDPIGEASLRNAVAEYAKTARGVNCTPDQIVITTGSQQALDLIGRILLNPGDAVWMEEPGYLGARGALIAAGATLVPVPVDQDGLRLDRGLKMRPDARLAYVSPSHQLPLGVTMSLSRRLELLHWANQAGSWILEDDYDSEYRYRQHPLCSLQGLDKHGRVIYIGTFSKVLFPALRLGYLIVPTSLIEAVERAQHFTIGQASIINQLVLAQFMTAGHFERHIRKMRVLYAERQQNLIAAVQRTLPDLLKIAPAQTGMHLVAWLHKGINDAAACAAAGRFGIEAIPISAFYLRRPRRGALLLGYAAFNRKKIEHGVLNLRAALESLSL